jgi:membrane-bound lytic murein transglycosylase A
MESRTVSRVGWIERPTMKQAIVLGVVLAAVMGSVGCRSRRVEPKIEYDRPLPPGQLALRKITDPNKYPDFSPGWRDLDTLGLAIQRSLSYLSKPSSRQYFPYNDITYEQVVKTLDTLLMLVDAGTRGEEIDGLVRAYFDVYESVGCDDRGTVLFTGYYTPILDGSFQQTGPYQYPLYKMPSDLVKGPDGQTLGRREADGRIVAYPTRAEIEESGSLKGQELLWLKDPFEAYIAHVQGSAKIRLPDGKIITAGYAANNGQEYQSVSKMLIEDGRIPSDRMSLAAMIDYFQNHPSEVATYVRRNPRYVFFQIGEGPPRGSLNEPVTAWRTIATDKSIFPRACPAYVATTLPQMERGTCVIRPYSGFALDQDTGGGIRAAGRCDIYLGVGDEAGRLAGQTYQEGRLYYLFLKP